MTVKLNTRNDCIRVQDMKDGQLAEIVQWDGSDAEVGSVVQRVGDRIVLIGRKKGYSYSSITTSIVTGCNVRLLKKGETIIVEENEGDV